MTRMFEYDNDTSTTPSGEYRVYNGGVVLNSSGQVTDKNGNLIGTAHLKDNGEYKLKRYPKVKRSVDEFLKAIRREEKQKKHLDDFLYKMA